jgi:hypothetical protein
MQIIYGLVCDGGDGSAHIRWFRDKNKVDELLDEDNGHEEYYANEGCPSVELNFPDKMDLSFCGFRFSD